MVMRVTTAFRPLSWKRDSSHASGTAIKVANKVVSSVTFTLLANVIRYR